MMRSLLQSLILVYSLCIVGSAWAGGVTVVGSQSRQNTLKPGEKAEGRIMLRNNGSEAGVVRIYPTDYHFTFDGRSEYGQPAGKAARSNSSWITFSPGQLTLAPGETGSVDYSVKVPSDEKLAGSYWSMLMVEPLAAGALEPPKEQQGKVSVGVQTVVRYAVQIITHIGDTGKRSVRYLNQSLVKDKEKLTLVADIENDGERALLPQAWIELFDEKGSSLGRFDGGKLRLYPGCSGRFTMDLSQLPKGKYSGLLIADNGDDYVFGTKSTIEIQ